MNYSIIRRILGIVVEFIGAFLLLPAICGLFYGEKQVIVYFVLAFVYFIAGRLIASIKLTRRPEKLVTATISESRFTSIPTKNPASGFNPYKLGRRPVGDSILP